MIIKTYGVHHSSQENLKKSNVISPLFIANTQKLFSQTKNKQTKRKKKSGNKQSVILMSLYCFD